MATEMRIKRYYAMATVLAGIAAAGITILAVTADFGDIRRLGPALTNPIVVPSDSVKIGVMRQEIERILGKPAKASDDNNTYYYYRRLEDYGKDQILVLRFVDDKLALIDSNVNLGVVATVSPCGD